MNYDIAIGRCIGFDAENAVVKLEGAMLVKLEPSFVFKGPTKALLKVARSVWSKTRPPLADKEFFVDRDAISAHPEAFLDYNGDDRYVSVDLRALLNDPSSNAPPANAQRPQASDYPNTLRRRIF
ncbi:hypothetical protein [Tahibacter soli]|jgi:hypothetical protein|uniref:Uncharacterized protein n=1 Tax=Tahibacter soli TaxID=2983605 RepID=A0A9X3YGK1_9GAMM|nr:hypothetical protein [Tahibacter soli]MDC8011042.1 hypothetical protein [Tahibacter soli]